MTAGDLAAVVLTVAGLAAAVVVLIVALSLLRTLRETRQVLATLRRDALPLVREMGEAVAAAGAEVERVDELVAQAEEVTASLEASSRVVDAAVTNPLIKLVALVRGIGRGLRSVLVPGRRRRRRMARSDRPESPRPRRVA